MARDPVRDRLRELMKQKGVDMKGLSRAIRRSDTFIYQFLRKGVPRRLKEDDREALANFFGVIADEFRHDVPHSNELLPNRSARQMTIAGDEFAPIPVYDLRFSAGPGSIIGDDPQPLYHQPFQLQWLRALGASDVERLVVAFIEGDSMEPTLLSGDQVLIDRHRREITRDGIYAYRIGDGLNVKRISVDPSSHHIAIASDNPRYPTHDNVNPDALDVIGRVIWLGRRV